MHNNKINRTILILVFSFVLGACSGISVSEPAPAETPTNHLRCTESDPYVNVDRVPGDDYEPANEFMAAIVQGVVEGLIEGLIHALIYH